MCYTDVSDAAAYWSTLYQSDPWNLAPSYTQLRGFHISMVAPDLLHVWNLGVLQTLLGSALKIILSDHVIFTQGDIESRMKAATVSLREYAKQNRLPLRWRKLSKGRLHWKSRTYPELGGSGYDSYVIARWLQHIIQPFTAVYPQISTLLWTSNRAIGLMYAAGWFLTASEKETVRTLGDIFCRTYISLAGSALSQGVLLWRVTPKFHLLKHCFRCDRSCNVSKFSTWVDEDYLKKTGRTLKLTCRQSCQKRCLQRWLLTIPGNLERCAQNRA